MDYFTAKQYLMIDIASNFGMDKDSWEDRIAWFEANQDNLLDFVEKAENPALFFAGVQAWDAIQNKQPIGYPISLDATSSGLQILAAITGDRAAAEICNVVDTGARQDAYKVIYQRMLQAINESSKISRGDCKDAIMTSLYGSEAVPKRVFGEGALLHTFFKTMEESAPAAWELNQTFLDIWDSNAYSNNWVLPDNFHVHVKVVNQVEETVHFLNQPFKIYRKVNAPIEKGRSLGANVIHSLDALMAREITRRCDYNIEKVETLRTIMVLLEEGSVLPEQSLNDNDTRMAQILWAHYEETGYLSARIMDHLWADNFSVVKDLAPLKELLDSLPKKPFKVISIHDCFRVLPHYGNDLREQYNRQLMMLARSSILQNLFCQLLHRKVTIGKLDKNLHKDIMDTNYALS